MTFASDPSLPPRVAIACGGTGGHLFPGLAVAESLFERGADVTLVVSTKEIDQQALRGEARFRILALPAVGFAWKRALGFAWQTFAAYRLARAAFRADPPAVLLAMGGFTSAPPALAARALGGVVLLHEANAIPGRANRWLASRARRAYTYFPEARSRWRARDVQVLGMPVRSQFADLDPGACRVALGLAPSRPVLLTMGGSQGAQAINEALLRALPGLRNAVPDLQYIHLTGPADFARVRAAHETAGSRAVVKPFLTEMDLALGAADAVVARAGASSAAEFAALRVPPLLVPYPHAADDHQVANARALEATGAARVLLQHELSPIRLTAELARLLGDPELRATMKAALGRWHQPDAAARLADDILRYAAPATAAAPRSGPEREAAADSDGPAGLPRSAAPLGLPGTP
jgi:UDP-N-acetylglucosamine--N-acetylmuramyl-(pentapeptide) pyrophosphoryl-undecaprenol N-acetylglucosamine transferase